MQMSLHHESMADALREVIQAVGGPKAVGERMFPDMPIDHAASRIRDCLNHDRRDRFTPDQVMMILRMGHQCGCHSGMVFIARELGYAEPVPVEPEDEVARLQREFVEASKSLMTMANKIERMQSRVGLKTAA
mgnify:FL=1